VSEYIHRSHNVTVLIYHLVFPAKYRRVVFDEAVDSVLKEICLDIEKRYQMKFLEIGTDQDHVHFLIQSVPTYNVTKIVTMLKSLTAREVFKRCPHVKKKLWGGEFWTDGYYASTVGKHGNENTIGDYVKKQGTKYQKLYEDRQLSLF
jgi:REP element-mobilizing transposase RayT